MTDLVTYLTERIAWLRERRQGWPIDTPMRAACTNGILELKSVQTLAEQERDAAVAQHQHVLAIADRMDQDDMTEYAYMIRTALGVEAKEPSGQT